MPTLYLQSAGGRFDFSEVSPKIVKDFCFDRTRKLPMLELNGGYDDKKAAILRSFKDTLKKRISVRGDRLLMYVIDDEVSKREEKEHDTGLDGLLLEAGKTTEETYEILCDEERRSNLAALASKYPSTLGLGLGYYPFIGICLKAGETPNTEEAVATTEHELVHTFIGIDFTTMKSCDDDCVGNCAYFMVNQKHEMCTGCKSAIAAFQRNEGDKDVLAKDRKELATFLGFEIGMVNKKRKGVQSRLPTE